MTERLPDMPLLSIVGTTFKTEIDVRPSVPTVIGKVPVATLAASGTSTSSGAFGENCPSGCPSSSSTSGIVALLIVMVGEVLDAEIPSSSKLINELPDWVFEPAAEAKATDSESV